MKSRNAEETKKKVWGRNFKIVWPRQSLWQLIVIIIVKNNQRRYLYLLLEIFLVISKGKLARNYYKLVRVYITGSLTCLVVWLAVGRYKNIFCRSIIHRNSRLLYNIAVICVKIIISMNQHEYEKLSRQKRKQHCFSILAC